MLEFSFVVAAVFTIAMITIVNSFSVTSFLGECLQLMFNALMIIAIIGALAIGASNNDKKKF